MLNVVSQIAVTLQAPRCNVGVFNFSILRRRNKLADYVVLRRAELLLETVHTA